MSNNWHGIMKVLYIEHLSKDNEVIWSQKNTYNILHTEGEEFIIKALFSSEVGVPASYYFGLDNRTSVAVGDEMADLVNEPSTNGYVRQSVAATTGFTIDNPSGNVRAITPILSFRATGGDWGPVSTLFITNAADDSGFLIASVALTETQTILDGEALNTRMSLTLKDCP